MEFVRGLVVRSLAGRDGSGFLVILSTDGRTAAVCDGKRRKLEHPKKKNLKHLSATRTILPESRMQTNHEIHLALAPFWDAGPLSRRGG